MTATPQALAATQNLRRRAVVVDNGPITCARQAAAPAVAWEDRQVMLGTARDQAAPLLGRAEEQSLMTSLLDKAHLPFAGLHQLLRPVRERAAELPPVR